MLKLPSMLISAFCLLTLGCAIGLPDGSAIQLTHVPTDQVEQNLEPDTDLEQLALSLGGGPILGALLYQFGLRPLRKRRERKNGTS